jgi:hypothetical protein
MTTHQSARNMSHIEDLMFNVQRFNAQRSILTNSPIHVICGTHVPTSFLSLFPENSACKYIVGPFRMTVADVKDHLFWYYYLKYVRVLVLNGIPSSD